MTERGYFRWPAVHGDRVVFVSEDDLWEVPLKGGVARRLTSGLGEVSHPTFSPDGSKIAYAGSEEGWTEVFVMDSRGGAGTQLTYMASRAAPIGWTEDGEILFRSNYGQFSPRYQTIFKVSTDGEHPTELGLGKAYWFCQQPGGKGRVLGRNSDDLARWKRYRGGTAGKLWINRGRGWRPLLAKLTSGLVRPMWIGERIYFVNDEDGTGNICSVKPDGKGFTQHTDHTGFYVRFAQTDGKTIIYTVGGELWAYDPKKDKAKKIKVDYASPQTQLNRKFADAERYLNEWSLHPKGQALAVTARGKLFTFGNWEGGVRQFGAAQGVRYRLPVLFDGGKQLLVTSDETGEEQLVIFAEDGTSRVVTDHDIGRASEFKLSPDEKRLAFTNHRHEMVVVELETGKTTIVERSLYLWIDGFDWSPDSRWLAYAPQDSSKTSLIRIYDVTTGDTHDVTGRGFQDGSPCFDPSGKYLYFVSQRWFDPVYDSLFFEISFPDSGRPCVITLSADEPSLFLEKPRPLDGGDDDEDDEKDDEDKDESSDKKDDDKKSDDDKKDDDKKDDEPEPVEIDFEGIGDRIEAFPVPIGQYGELRATEDYVFWIHYSGSRNASSHGTLEWYNLEKRKKKEFVSGANAFDLSADRKTLVYDGPDGLRVVSASSEPGDEDPEKRNRKTGWIDLGRVPVSVDVRAEWRQMLREAWRLMRDQYWDPQLCGIDWDVVWARYEPLVERVASRSEFSDLVWTMQGELGTSHAYEMGGDYRRPPYYPPGLLAADFRWDKKVGGFRIEHIAKGLTWEKNQSSPLAAPGVNARVGEHVMAVNGRRFDGKSSLMEAFVRLAGREVDLTLRGNDGEERTVIIKTLYSEYGPRYRDWVARNRAHVHDKSGGRLGYVHIPDMSAQGFAEFHRGYLHEVRRDGLVVDVRNNGGGHVSQLILEKLARTQIGYDVSRWAEPWPYPEDSVAGPLIAVTDENAGSDGDIFSHAFKLMGLGTLVGTRTWGGVVGIWPRHGLVDGSVTTQPEFAYWFKDVGFAVENYGTDPDVVVELPPESKDDPQLDKAIELVMKQLKANPPKMPEFGPSPNILQPPKV